MAGGSTNIEQHMRQSDGQSIQSNLCVRPSASFDDTTRDAIRQAKVGANQSGPGERPFKIVSNRIENLAEAQFFLRSRVCNLDTSGTDRGYRTPFEKYTFAGEAGVVSLQQLLVRCDPNLKDKFSGKFDPPTRAAITVAKTRMETMRFNPVSSSYQTRQHYAA